jgi:uncharacterized surface protein with fasciclin (FAS1) repeats
MMRTINYLCAIGTLSLLMACGGQQSEATADLAVTADATPAGGQAMIEDNVSAKNIVQVAAGSTDHTTLVAAVQAAGLVNVLANNGPFTVFAPTNAAFAALPEGTVETLLKPENKSQLVNIIHYHAAPGTYKDAYLKDGMNLFMANGSNAKIAVNEAGDVTVNGANILATIQATNGVIHVVDKVLLPPEK